MVTRYLILIALSITLLAFCGCNGLIFGKSSLDENWGNSFQQAKSSQILNPDAGKKIEPEKSYDGKTAENTINAYHEKFSGSKKEENVNIIKLR